MTSVGCRAGGRSFTNQLEWDGIVKFTAQRLVSLISSDSYPVYDFSNIEKFIFNLR